MKTYHVGDIVLVNGRAFVNPPLGDKWIECKVMRAGGGAQIYVAPTRTLGYAQHVFRHHIKDDNETG